MRTPKEYTTNLKNGIITEQMLAFLDPVCIHQQYIGKERVRVYSTDPEYKSSKHDNKIVHTGHFYDYEKDDYVHFFDYETDENRYLYFLYYEVGDKSFHTPIQNPNDYDLEIVKIQDDFTTEGQNPNSLLSPQFVIKVLETLYTKKCQLILSSKTLTFEERPVKDDKSPVIKKKNYNITERQSEFVKELCEFYDKGIPELKKQREASKWISEFLKNHNYSIDKRKRDTLERYKNIFKDYQGGLTMDELIEKYKVKGPTIKKAIKTISEQN